MRQALLPGLRLPRVDGFGNGQFAVPLPETAWDCVALPVGFGASGVALGAANGEAEQVAEPPDVAAGGQGLVQDAVLADGLRGNAEGVPDPGAADRGVAYGGVPVDEQVRVDGGGPAAGALVEPGGQPLADGAGQRNVAAVEVEPPVADDTPAIPSGHKNSYSSKTQGSSAFLAR